MDAVEALVWMPQAVERQGGAYLIGVAAESLAGKPELDGLCVSLI